MIYNMIPGFHSLHRLDCVGGMHYATNAISSAYDRRSNTQVFLNEMKNSLHSLHSPNSVSKTSEAQSCHVILILAFHWVRDAGTNCHHANQKHQTYTSVYERIRAVLGV